MRTVVLDGRSLTSEAVLAVAESRAKVECAPDALERVRLARAAVEGIIARGEVVYGINTGFGALVNTRIDSDDLETLQLNLIRSHATAIGEPMPDVQVRAMMVVRLNSLSVATQASMRTRFVNSKPSSIWASHPLCQGWAVWVRQAIWHLFPTSPSL